MVLARCGFEASKALGRMAFAAFFVEGKSGVLRMLRLKALRSPELRKLSSRFKVLGLFGGLRVLGLRV